MNEGDFWVIKSDEQRANVIDHLLRVCTPSVTEPWSVKIQPYTGTRREAQSRLAHKWFAEVAKQGKEYTPNDVKQIAKLTYAVPILLVQEESFAAYWAKVLPLFPTYEEQWQELMPRTQVLTAGVLNVKQMSEFMNQFRDKASQKYQLTDPALYGLEEKI